MTGARARRGAFEHTHGLSDPDGKGTRRRLAVSLVLTLAVFVIQVVGALLSGSLALLADSAHVLTDGTGLTLAVIAASLAARPATPRRTFGWKRAEILAALANGLLMLCVCVFVVVEGVQRLAAPPPVEAPVMILASTAGLIVNVTVMMLLARSSRDNLNVRGAYLEVWGDAVGSVFVVVAGVVIQITGFARADGIASLLIGALILPRAVVLIRAALEVLLEATPKGVDIAEIRAHLGRIPGVSEIHDLHVWSITSGMPSLTVHARIDAAHASQVASGQMLARFQECAREHFDLTHSTFQLELDEPTAPVSACEAEHADGVGRRA